MYQYNSMSACSTLLRPGAAEGKEKWGQTHTYGERVWGSGGRAPSGVLGAEPWADFKVGVQNRIHERSERKKIFVPPLLQMWGVQESKYLYRGLLNILKFAVWLSH